MQSGTSTIAVQILVAVLKEVWAPICIAQSYSQPPHSAGAHVSGSMLFVTVQVQLSLSKVPPPSTHNLCAFVKHWPLHSPFNNFSEGHYAAKKIICQEKINFSVSPIIF